ncbi:MAG: ABC transporter ATP-binding protein [Acidimicrobiia bacterium]|nr:ABC transporter ATP-binding protein [Acidimicrobiia bacterium]
MLKSWRVFHYLRPYLPIFGLASLFMAAAAAFEGFRALLVRPLLDNVLVLSSASNVRIELVKWPLSGRSVYLDQVNPFPSSDIAVAVALLLVTATLLKGIAEYVSTYCLNRLGQFVVMDLRNDVYDKILHQSASFFHSHATGRLISRVTNDVEKIQFACSTVLADALKQSLTFVAFMAIVFAIDWTLALASLVIAPLIIYPSKFLGRKIHKTSRSSQDKMEEISNVLQETITGHRIVKAFGMEEFELNRFRQATRRLAYVNLKWVRTQAISSPYMELIGAMGFGVMLFYIQGQVLTGEMTLGKFGVFLTALACLYDPVRRMSGIYNTFQQAKGASSKVFELIDQRSEVVDQPGAQILRGFAREIEFRRVSFNYSDSRLPVLKEVDLTVCAGEVIAFVGSSGSGKTTLVNLLPRFFDPTEGQILIDGADTRDVTLSSLRAQIGIVTQETVLFNDTVRNNVCYGRAQVTEKELLQATQAALAHDFIVQLPNGYDSIIGERGQKLSGGQRQRIAIARALLKNSPILILDEATSALDSESEMLVQKALANLIRGRTVFVIAHRLSTIRQASKIIVIDQGRISEAGTHADLVGRGGIYQRLHDLQFAGTDVSWVS